MRFSSLEQTTTPRRCIDELVCQVNCSELAGDPSLWKRNVSYLDVSSYKQTDRDELDWEMVFLYRQGSITSKSNYLSQGWRGAVTNYTGITEQQFETDWYYNSNSLLYDLGFENYVLSKTNNSYTRDSLDLLYRYFSALQGFQKLCIQNPTWKSNMTSKMDEWWASSDPNVITQNEMFSVTLWSVENDLLNFQNNATAETDPIRKQAAQKRVDDFYTWKVPLTNRFISLVQNDLFQYADCMDFQRYYVAWIRDTLDPSDPQRIRWEGRLVNLTYASTATCLSNDTIGTGISFSVTQYLSFLSTVLMVINWIF